ncbi:hypothetical protein XBJ1_2999 [Xenorhabdus bovienii SS-2004]|uniref:Uncharacterized protein n=1 Tax=Xenorhabdus bovienii (strain SS-2004) TaxID=406818 RepID=D3V8G1_XENBS|nr:hypothetical protein XBJ1_2999 [Xenorhabdus bovienii SS-2004]
MVGSQTLQSPVIQDEQLTATQFAQQPNRG